MLSFLAVWVGRPRFGIGVGKDPNGTEADG